MDPKLYPNRLADDPEFTGSRQYSVGSESTTVSMPALIRVQKVDLFTNGIIDRTHFIWSVYMNGNMVARYGFGIDPLLKTRKAAVSAAKRAVRAYAALSRPDTP